MVVVVEAVRVSVALVVVLDVPLTVVRLLVVVMLLLVVELDVLEVLELDLELLELELAVEVELLDVDVVNVEVPELEELEVEELDDVRLVLDEEVLEEEEVLLPLLDEDEEELLLVLLLLEELDELLDEEEELLEEELLEVVLLLLELLVLHVDVLEEVVLEERLLVLLLLTVLVLLVEELLLDVEEVTVLLVDVTVTVQRSMGSARKQDPGSQVSLLVLASIPTPMPISHQQLFAPVPKLTPLALGHCAFAARTQLACVVWPVTCWALGALPSPEPITPDSQVNSQSMSSDEAPKSPGVMSTSHQQLPGRLAATLAPRTRFVAPLFCALQRSRHCAQLVTSCMSSKVPPWPVPNLQPPRHCSRSRLSEKRQDSPSPEGLARSKAQEQAPEL